MCKAPDDHARQLLNELTQKTFALVVGTLQGQV